MREAKNRTQVAWKMDELRSWWEVPSIAHFCSLFRSAFDLTDFDIEDLEDAFLEAQRDEGSEFLTDLVCRLLKGCYRRKDLTVLNYDLYVKDLIKYKWEGTGNPIAEKSEFKELTLREKVDLIHAICEYRLDAEDVPELLKGFEGDNMRVEPLGKDKDGGTYWYFYGSRLYKEDPPPKKEVSREEKRTKDKQRKKQLEKKRRGEKKQKKVEKQKRKALKKSGKRAKVSEPVVEAEDDGNIRRSGRLRIKKTLQKFISESSESSSSSEEESPESSSEEEEIEEPEEEIEEEPEKPTKKKNSKKTPARKTPAKKTPAKKTPVKKPEESTPSRPQRQTARQRGKARGTTSQRNKVEETPELESGVRRSGRIRGRRSVVSRRDESDTEEEVKDDIDSGHESGVTDDDDDTKSEASKLSVKSSISKSSPRATPIARRITLPRASANIEKGSLDTGDEDEDKDDLEQIEEEKTQNDDDKDGEIDEETSKSDITDKDKEKSCPDKDDTPREDKENCHSENEEELNTKVSDTTEVEKSQLPTEQVSVTDNDPEKDLIDDSEKEMEVEESISAGNAEVNGSNAASDVAPAAKDLDTDDREILNDNSTEGKCTSTAEAMETDQSVNEECANTENKSEDKTINEAESNTKDKLNTNRISDGMESEDNNKPENKNDISEMEEDKKAISEIDTGLKVEPGNLKKDIESKSKDIDETIKTEEKDDKTNGCEQQTETVKDIKNENGSDDMKQEGLKSEVKEQFIKTETDESQENQNEDEMETEEKEKVDVGPKTTLGKQKPFGGPAVPPPPSKSDTRWHMVCSTLDDWINLAEWFSNSQVRCEKAIYKLINDDFLPVLPEIIEAREKERKQRLLELDVRRSNRITLKMKEKMEQEKILAEALALEEKEKLRLEEERRLKEEQQRLEEEIRLREERLKAREERANRLSMREVRSKLIAEGKEIPPELLYTATNKYNDDYDSDDSRNDLKTDEDYNNLSRLVDAMKIHKDCWPFLEPVSDEVAPGYSEVIKRPMDLTKIEEKTKKRDYKSTQHFLSDFRLMFNNCKRFNGPDSEFTESARTMEAVLKKYKKRFLTDDPGNSSYYQDKDFTLSVKGGRQGDKKFRPRRAASSRAMETVHKALASSDEGSESEEEMEPSPKRRKPAEFPATQPSHQSLLLQEMIEMKRQREKNLAASALQNHQVITRGPERVRLQNPQGGVTIIPKGELQTKGLLKLAATREIKRKVNPQFSEMLDLSKKDPGLSVSSNTVAAGAGKIKTIRIVAPTSSNALGNAVKETAESVKVSGDGFLIIGGKNSGIKVSENTKIVVQPPGTSPSTTNAPAQGREILIKKIPTPSGLKEIPGIPSTVQLPRVLLPEKSGLPSMKSDEPRSPAILNVSSAGQINNSRGNLPTIIRQHQIINKGLNSSSGIVTQNPTSLQSLQASNKLNAAQNTALLQQKQKMLLQRQQQQNGSNMQSNPPKIIKLSAPQSGGAMLSPNPMSIEERLREPNLDKVADNVVKSVNIAGDILDSYYSVLNNSSKSTPPQTRPVIQPGESQPVTKTVGYPHNTQAHVTMDIKSLILQSMVNNKTITNVSSPSLNQFNKPSIPTSNGSLTQRPVGMVNTHEVIQNNAFHGSSSNYTVGANVITNSRVQLSSVDACGSIGQGTVGQSVGQTPHTFEQNTSHAAIQLSTQNTIQIPGGISTPSNMTPIEALFTGNTASNVTTNHHQRVSNDQSVQLAVSTPMLQQSASIQGELLKPVPSDLRQNVFDMFGSDRKGSDSSGQDPNPTFNTEQPCKELLKGMKGSSGTVNFGSPLKTLSVMEALKSKLSQSPKQEPQPCIIRKNTPDMNALEVNEKVVSNACVPPYNPVVTSVLSPCSPACTCSNYSSTSPGYKTDTSNSGTGCKTDLKQPRKSTDNLTEIDSESDKKDFLYDCNGNLVCDWGESHETSTKEISSDLYGGEQQLGDVQNVTSEQDVVTCSVDTGVIKNEEIELCKYQFDSQSECWERVQKEDNNLKDEDRKPLVDEKIAYINQGYPQSVHCNPIETEQSQSICYISPNTETNKVQSSLEGADEDSGKVETKRKSMYVIMIPNSNNKETNPSAIVTKLADHFPNDERVTYLNNILQKKSLLNKARIAKSKRRDTFPPDCESGIVAFNSAKPIQEQFELKHHGIEKQSRTLGKVHFHPLPSRKFEDPIKKQKGAAFTSGSKSLRMSKSTPELSAHSLDPIDRENMPMNKCDNEDSEIEQYLNEFRAKQKAFRITTDPIRTYQLHANSQTDQPSPKCLSLKDIDVVKIKRQRQKGSGYRSSGNTGKGEPKQSTKRPKVRKLCSKPNSYLVKKCLDDALNEKVDTELDNSLTCDEEFFTSEVLSNLFPPNLGDGDSETDNVFKDIEHELFDLQDFEQQGSGSQQWNNNIQSPILHHQFVNYPTVETKTVVRPVNVLGQAGYTGLVNEHTVRTSIPGVMTSPNQAMKPTLNSAVTAQHIQRTDTFGPDQIQFSPSSVLNIGTIQTTQQSGIHYLPHSYGNKLDVTALNPHGTVDLGNTVHTGVHTIAANSMCDSSIIVDDLTVPFQAPLTQTGDQTS